MAQAPRNDQSRNLLLIAGLVAVVAVVGLVIALVVGGGDDDSADDAAAFRPVTVDGDPLPALSQEVLQGQAEDPAIGQQVPVVSGVDYDDTAITIDPATDGPTMVVLLAHWCPHCNDEIPVLNEWRDSGEIPDDLNIVGVSTGVSSDRPNYPPGEWLEEKDWQWPVLADDIPPDDQSPPPAMGAYGGISYPTIVLVAGDGSVFRRLSGEVPIEVLDPLVDELLAESPS